MKGFVTHNFNEEVASINIFYGWPNDHITTWQTEPIFAQGNQYIIWKPVINEWCELNSKEIVDIPEPS